MIKGNGIAIRFLACVLLCWQTGWALAAPDLDDQEAPNPADPTAAASHIEINPEYNSGPELSATLFRFVFDYDFAQGVYSVTADVPVGQVRFKNEQKTETGLGDIRTRFFWRFFDNPSSGGGISNMVFNLDAFVPTGDSEKGLGLGTVLLVPSVILAVPISEKLDIFPWVKYKQSTGKTQGRSSPFPPGRQPLPERETEEYISALEMEPTFLFTWTGQNAFITLAPVLEFDLLPEPDEDNYELTFRGSIVKMMGRFGLGFEGTTFVAGEKSQDLQVKLLFSYYF